MDPVQIYYDAMLLWAFSLSEYYKNNGVYHYNYRLYG